MSNAGDVARDRAGGASVTTWRVRPTDLPGRLPVSDIVIAPTPGLSAALYSTEVGGLVLHRFTASAHRARWNSELTRRPSALLVLVLEGRLQTSEGPAIGPGTLIARSPDSRNTWHTFERITALALELPEGAPAHLTRFPRTVLMQPEERTPVVSAFAALLGSFAQFPLDPKAVRFLSRGLTDLSLAVLAELAERGVSSPADAARLRAHAHIEQHLADPALDPAAVAAAIGLSPKALQTLFRSEGTSVARTIRERRLALAALALRHEDGEVAITDLAARFGFAGPDQFTRAFRARYGLPPGAYRAGSAVRVDSAGNAVAFGDRGQAIVHLA